MHTSQAFLRKLHSEAPAADRAEKLALYGWLIGDWELQGVVHRDDGSTHPAHGEAHFGWVLEGRAIQDVWILPGVFYGSTLRVYDPSLDAWRIIWSDPVRQVYVRQLGRAEGADIVQEGKTEDGALLRWSFRNITPASFTWRGERSQDEGRSWSVQADFELRRTSNQESEV